MHDVRPRRNERVHLDEGGDDIVGREQVDGSPQVLLQLSSSFIAVHVDALEEPRAHPGGELAVVEARAS